MKCNVYLKSRASCVPKATTHNLNDTSSAFTCVNKFELKETCINKWLVISSKGIPVIQDLKWFLQSKKSPLSTMPAIVFIFNSQTVILTHSSVTSCPCIASQI